MRLPRIRSPAQQRPFPTSLSGGQPDCPSLRALREHILIVRPQRARRMVWLVSVHPSEGARSTIQMILPSLLISLQGSGQGCPLLRASDEQASPCAFCEQEGHLAAPYPPLPQRTLNDGSVKSCLSSSICMMTLAAWKRSFCSPSASQNFVLIRVTRSANPSFASDSAA